MSQHEETIVQYESIEELRRMDNTHGDDVDDITDIKATRRYYNLRPNRTINYSNMKLLQDVMIVMNGAGSKEPVFKHLTCITMTKMSAKASIKKHRKLARDA